MPSPPSFSSVPASHLQYTSCRLSGKLTLNFINQINKSRRKIHNKKEEERGGAAKKKGTFKKKSNNGMNHMME